MEKMSSACAPESSGRIIAGVVIGLLSSVFLILFIIEFTTRPVLDLPLSTVYDDTPLLLLWADISALAAGFVSSFLLLLPELCCESRDRDDPSCREDFRRERYTASLVLIITVVVFSTTARVRDVNLSTKPNDHQVCGARSSTYACPTQRVALNEAYLNFLKAGNPTCWFNTTAPSAQAFTWGEELKDASVYPTADFSDVQTYRTYPRYANCYFWGCGGTSCTPEVYNHHDIMLKLEIAVAVIFTGLILVAMCVGLPATQYAYVSVGEIPTAVGIRREIQV